MCDAGPLSSIVWTNFLASGWFVHCYFLSCYFFSYLPTVSFSLLLLSYCYPDWINETITYFPNTCILTWPLLLSFLLLFFLLAHCFFSSCHFIHTATQMNCYLFTRFFSPYLSTVTFFPVTFFPTWNCYFLSCYLFSCYFLSMHRHKQSERDM